MKIANSNGRAVIVLGDEIADVAEISGGKFGPDPMTLYQDLAAFAEFASTVSSGTGPLVETALRNPVPTPRQVFAIGINYRSHAEEAAMVVPDVPAGSLSFPRRCPVRSTTSRSPATSPTGRWSSSR